MKKKIQSKLRDLDNELKNEKESRAKLEKEVANLRLDCDYIDSQLQDALNARDKEVSRFCFLKK